MEKCTSVGNLELLLLGRRHAKENVRCLMTSVATASLISSSRITVDMSFYACATLGCAMVELWYVLMCSAGVLAFLSVAFICA